MKITIESTPVITILDGRDVRLWQGLTEGGNRVKVFVVRVASDTPEGQAELEAALLSMAAPGESVPPRIAVPLFILAPSEGK